VDSFSSKNRKVTTHITIKKTNTGSTEPRFETILTLYDPLQNTYYICHCVSNGNVNEYTKRAIIFFFIKIDIFMVVQQHGTCWVISTLLPCCNRYKYDTSQLLSKINECDHVVSKVMNGCRRYYRSKHKIKMKTPLEY
jgi:hypothetical protein